MRTIALIICALVITGGVVWIALAGHNNNLTSPQTGAEISASDSLHQPITNPRIVVIKSKRRLMLYSGDKLWRTYRVGLGFSPVKDKVKEGDGATPEGEFYIFTKNPESAYYLSLGISYPNAEDAQRGLRARLINKEQYLQIVEAIENRAMPPQDTPLGGQIYIHGEGSHKDWTWGCVALDNKDMKELFDAVPIGTKVIIKH